MDVIIATLATALIITTKAPPRAAAQDGRVYFGAMGCANPMADSDASGTDINKSIAFETDATYLFNGGYNFGNLFDLENPIGLRLEVELGYRLSDVRSVTGRISSGEVASISAMTNLMCDIGLGLPVVPYLGIGAGMARVDFDTVTNIGASANQTGNRAVGF